MRVLGWTCERRLLARIGVRVGGESIRREVPNRRSEQGWEKSQYRWSVGCTAANACRWPSTPAPCPGQELMGRAPYIDAHTACGHVDHAPTGHRVNPWTTHSVAHRLPLGPHPHWLLPQLLHIHTTDHTSLSKGCPRSAAIAAWRHHEYLRGPFALSLSKGCPSTVRRLSLAAGFDKLSPNGINFDPSGVNFSARMESVSARTRSPAQNVPGYAPPSSRMFWPVR